MEQQPKQIDAVETGFEHFRKQEHNMNEHYDMLRHYAGQCSNITEFGASESMTSTWPLLAGLKDNPATRTELTSFDRTPIPTSFSGMQALASNEGTKLRFIQGNTLNVKIQPTNMLLIDTFHAYPQLKKELERHHKKVDKFIAILNTDVDGEHSEVVRLYYCYDFDTCMSELQCTQADLCKGLRPAIDEFIDNHPEWECCETCTNNNGLMILKRKAT
jgi:hypothetical protein